MVRTALDALRAQDFEGPLELLVVGDPARMEIVDLVTQLGGRFVPEAGASIGLRRTRAVREASGELVAFTDADCRADTNWLGCLVAALGREGGACGAFGVTEHDPKDNLTYRAAAKSGLLQGFVMARVTPFFAWAPCSNVVVRRAQAIHVGGFDATLDRAGEDVDFGLRLTRQHGPLVAVPDAVVRHDHDAFARGIWRRAWSWGAADAALLRRHPDLGRPSPPPQLLWTALAVVTAALVQPGWTAPTAVVVLSTVLVATACVRARRDVRVCLLAGALAELQDVARRVAGLLGGPRRSMWTQPVFGVGHARLVLPSWGSRLTVGSFQMLAALVIGTLLR